MAHFLGLLTNPCGNQTLGSRTRFPGKQIVIEQGEPPLFPCRKSRSLSSARLSWRRRHAARRTYLRAEGDAVRLSLGVPAVIVSGFRRRNASVSGGSMTGWRPSAVLLHGGGQMALIGKAREAGDFCHGKLAAGLGRGLSGTHTFGDDVEDVSRRSVATDASGIAASPNLAWVFHSASPASPPPESPPSPASTRNQRNAGAGDKKGHRIQRENYVPERQSRNC